MKNIADLKIHVDSLQKRFYDQIATLNNSKNYSFDAGVCEGQIRAITMIQKFLKEISDD